MRNLVEYPLTKEEVLAQLHYALERAETRDGIGGIGGIAIQAAIDLVKANCPDVVRLEDKFYPKAAPGGAVILYCRHPDHGRQVLLQRRSAAVGTGLGLSAGGFMETEKLIHPGAEIDCRWLIWLEVMEELPAIVDIVKYSEFVERGEFVYSCLARKEDANVIHACIYFSLEISKEKMEKLVTVPADPYEVDGVFLSHIDKDTLWGQRNDFYHHQDFLALTAFSKREKWLT